MTEKKESLPESDIAEGDFDFYSHR